MTLPYGLTNGPVISNLHIRGDRLSTNQQNALAFHDRDDNVYVDNVFVEQLPGYCMVSGTELNASQAYIRESEIASLRCQETGQSGIASILLDSYGSANTDGTMKLILGKSTFLRLTVLAYPFAIIAPVVALSVTSSSRSCARRACRQELP